MKKPRKFCRSLTTHFDRCVDPIYLVDAKREIAYMNAACLEWVGLAPEDAQDLRCFYTSDETDAAKDDPVKGLCPPPELFFDSVDQEASNGSATARIFAQGADGVKWRTARFNRLLDDAGQLLGVLVIAKAATKTSSATPAATSSSSDSLHEALAAIRDHHRQSYSMGNLIGVSPFAERLRRQADAIIGLDAETLITGPPGSGREHLARTIATACCDGDVFPVAVLHCVLADEELAQETIDQVADRVTLRTRRGRAVPNFSSDATKPILLLLDIDKLASNALSLVESFLTRTKSACRVIATSETSLLQLASAGEFSKAMAHLLTTIEVPLVALSQRREDIPLMAQAFVEHANRTREQQLTGFDDASLQLLNEFSWPGNLEQLQQVVGDACERAGGPSITTLDLPDSFRHAVQAFRIGQAEETKIDLQQWLGQLEQELIQRAIMQARGNKTKAAELLSVTRSKLIRRMGSLGITAGSEDSGKAEPSSGSNEMIDPSAFEELE